MRQGLMEILFTVGVIVVLGGIGLIKAKVLAPKAASTAADGIKAYKKGFASFKEQLKEEDQAEDKVEE